MKYRLKFSLIRMGLWAGAGYFASVGNGWATFALAVLAAVEVKFG